MLRGACFRQFRDGLAARLRADSMPLHSDKFAILALALFLAGRWRSRAGSGGMGHALWYRSAACQFVVPAIVIGSEIANHRLGPEMQGVLAVISTTALVFTAFWGHRRVQAGLVAGYPVRSAFLVAIGLGEYARLSGTCAFLLPLAVTMLRVPAADECGVPSTTETMAAAVAARLLLVVQYSAVFWWPSPWRTQFSDSTDGHRVAIGLSEDTALNRSLYLMGDRILVYTRSHGFPLGRLRTYSSRRYSDRAWNRSFLEPTKFVL